MLIHATSLAIESQGVLLVGPAGVGKSDVALRLVDGGAHLIADDQTEVRIENGILMAGVPKSIAGLFEVRHIGLVRMPFVSAARVVLYVELVGGDVTLERLPDADNYLLLDQKVRRLRLPAYAASTPAKIRAALLYPLANV